ncbi:MAG TPA: hypothetical protein DCS39_02900 [Rhodobiaceae bacterium]|nr:hypothetical protein [Rhodobiaceae bacterium]|tara:strand:- start:158 stop:412 length:255 start_codon:yes stop_codon:yes gene_type:complete
MKHGTVTLVCASLLAACATDGKDDISSLDDPKFVSWYEAASPNARSALFITLCAAQGFSKGSVDISLCVSNMRRDSRIRIEGRL